MKTERTGFSGTGITDVCELPCECWEWHPGPLKEQPELYTAEPSPQAAPASMLNPSLAVICKTSWEILSTKKSLVKLFQLHSVLWPEASLKSSG